MFVLQQSVNLFYEALGLGIEFVHFLPCGIYKFIVVTTLAAVKEIYLSTNQPCHAIEGEAHFYLMIFAPP